MHVLLLDKCIKIININVLTEAVKEDTLTISSATFRVSWSENANGVQLSDGFTRLFYNIAVNAHRGS